MLFNTVGVSKVYLEDMSEYMSGLEREERARRGLGDESDDEEVDIVIDLAKLDNIKNNVD